MATRYLLDTNTVSYVIKGNMPGVRERLLKVPMAEVAISAVTEAELRFGVARRPEAAKLKLAVEEFLLRVESLQWGTEAARSYATLRFALEEDARPMGNMDMMIAAQALAAKVILVTHDPVFQRIKGLAVQDWTQAS